MYIKNETEADETNERQRDTTDESREIGRESFIPAYPSVSGARPCRSLIYFAPTTTTTRSSTYDSISLPVLCAERELVGALVSVM
jgi:hypothetical protein